MNVNDLVWVRLTAAGRKTYEDSGRGSKYRTPDSLGYLSFQLWELMSLFGGSRLGLCSPVPFESNEIFFESPASLNCEEDLRFSDKNPAADTGCEE